MDPPRSGAPAFPYTPLYAFTISLGSFLLFLLEPLYAKLILPWFGGSSSVWALCLAFYQTALLAGYGYAHLSRRLSPLHRTLLHIGLLISCLAFLPITPDPRWRPQPGSNPAFLLLGLLTARIGLPFALLSASSPLLQSWYAARLPHRRPYLLFALSNAASLAGLLFFVAWVEPNLPSRLQVALWSGLFVLYVAACALCAWTGRQGTADPLPLKVPSPLPWTRKLSWVALSAGGSMLLLSVTNHLTQDVAPVPLLWVVPLSLYLLSFILVFGWEGFYSPVWAAAAGVALVVMNYAFYEPDFVSGVGLKLIILGAGLLLACLFCHGELARLKPDPSHLTSYYWRVALGGALGSLFVGLAAPQVFPTLLEYPLSLIFVSALALMLLWGKRLFTRTVWVIVTLFLAGVFAWNTHMLGQGTLVMVRDFYAALRVIVQRTSEGEEYRTLCNGVVLHGEQFQAPRRAREGTTYYAPASGAGLALRFGAKGPLKAGLIGLGAGTLAVYGKPGDTLRFYEINPQVVDVAQRYFSFLKDSRARVEVVPGDARLSLVAEKPNGFDVLVVDAFSGDAVPVHLLTREAFELYLSHLKPGGILAFHTTNRHLSLAPVVKELADQLGYPCLKVVTEKDDEALINHSEWVLVTKDGDFLRKVRTLGKVEPIGVPAGLKPWTDDYNSLFTVLR
jgi:hypothetical protein